MFPLLTLNKSMSVETYHSTSIKTQLCSLTEDIKKYVNDKEQKIKITQSTVSPTASSDKTSANKLR